MRRASATSPTRRPSRDAVAALAAAALLAGAAACGRREGPEPDPFEAAQAAADAGDAAGLRRRLEAVEEEEGDRGRVATTWRLRLALADGDWAGVAPRVERLVRRHGGAGLDERGRVLDAGLLASAAVERCAAAAREAVEGPRPDAARAAAALAGADAVAALGVGVDEEVEAALARARAWVGLADAPLAPRLAAAGLASGPGPRVVVLCDAFEAGEAVLDGVLARWARGARVEVAGLLVGAVRAGMRRVPASPGQEEEALRAAARAWGATFLGALDAQAQEALGVAGAGAAVLVTGPDDRLVARSSGHALDPRALEPVLAPAR